jgi:uncharacterized membrane protein YphA (DoxX/SURF4 family)
LGIAAGRVLQIVAGTALVIGWHERVAALCLGIVLVPATLTAHEFWAYQGAGLQGQLVNVLKNVAMIGGLCFVAFRSAPASRPGSLVERQDDASLQSCMSSQRSQ